MSATQQPDRYLQMSMSKAYTAVLVLQAIDAGRFTLDTRVADLVNDAIIAAMN